MKASRPRRGRPSARDAIIDAAAQVAAETGARHLTLEAVAAKAGMSKGGLLYHFPTKDALLAGLVQRHIDEIAETGFWDEVIPPSPGKALRSLWAARKASQEREACDNEMACALMAAAAESPDLLKPVHEFHKALWVRLEAACASPGMRNSILLAWLALEGLFFFDLFKISPLDDDARAQFLANAYALLDGTAILAPGDSSRT